MCVSDHTVDSCFFTVCHCGHDFEAQHSCALRGRSTRTLTKRSVRWAVWLRVYDVRTFLCLVKLLPVRN